MSEPLEDICFKVIVLGDSAVGKSCLLTQFVEERFNPSSETTVGVGYGKRVITDFAGNSIMLEIWDTAGQEIYRSIARSFYHKSNAALLVYDMTRMRSFQAMESWLAELRHQVPYIPVYLVANMKDLSEHREVPSDSGHAYSSTKELSGFAEVSAKTGEGVQKVGGRQLFRMVAQDLMNAWSEAQKRRDISGVSLASVLRQQLDPEVSIKEEKCKC